MRRVYNVIKKVMNKLGRVILYRLDTEYTNEWYLKLIYKYCTGKKLDLKNPKSFNEKLQWLKLYNCNPEYTSMVDKLSFKSIVNDKLGEGYVFPTIGVWEKFDEIDKEKLPNQFVLKCTHDSGSIVIVKNKELWNVAEAKKKINKAMKSQYYLAGRELPYKRVKKQIIAEPYMADADDMIDYKFMCFNGKVKMIFTCTERNSETGLKVTFFDTEWNKLPFIRHYPASDKVINKPVNFEQMMWASEKLSEGIPFVRVDFYEIKGKMYVGEMTFSPGGGMEQFEPEEWDYMLGEWIELPKF